MAYERFNSVYINSSPFTPGMVSYKFTIQNNNIYQIASNKAALQLDTTVTCDYNNIYTATSTENILRYQGTSYTLDQCISGEMTDSTGLMANGVYKDPKFTDINTRNFKPKARELDGTGFNWGNTGTDYDGVGQGVPYDIGAYQFRVSTGWDKRFHHVDKFWRYRRR